VNNGVKFVLPKFKTLWMYYARLVSAKGENPNALFATYTMPCKASAAANKTVDLRPTWLYDIDTKPNQVIEIIK
jgi:hypothetical protein